MNRFRASVPLPVAFIIMAIGLAVALYSFTRINKAKASENWPTTPAEVVSSEVRATERSEARQVSNTTYRAEISFRYKVNGKEHISDQLMIDQPEKSYAKDVQTIVENFPVGKTVLAHYNPRHPSDAVLEIGASAGIYIAFLFGAVLAFIGMMLFGFRMFANRREPDYGLN
jgi:hypothetical protein